MIPKLISQKSMLIIEDTKTNNDIVKDIYQCYGLRLIYQSFTFMHALKMIMQMYHNKGKCFDIVLLDYQLNKGQTGVDILDAVGHIMDKSLKVGMSGSDDSNDKLLKAGCDLVFNKIKITNPESVKIVLGDR